MEQGHHPTENDEYRIDRYADPESLAVFRSVRKPHSARNASDADGDQDKYQEDKSA